MPKIKTTQPISAEFAALKAEGAAIGERNDCTVKAIAIVTGKTYAECHAAMAAAGRKSGQGAYDHQIVKALMSLGFKAIYDREFCDKMIATYPGAHSTLKSVTTHHPQRFAKAWANADLCADPLLLFTPCHVSAFRDGRVHDWAEGRAKRVTRVMRIQPL